MTGMGAWEMAGTAETNLAVEEVKGAVAMTRDVCGWEIGAALVTGASVTGSSGSRVVVSNTGASVFSKFWAESLTSITTSSSSSFTGDTGAKGAKGATGTAGAEGPGEEMGAGTKGACELASENMRPSAVWKSCPG